jgi:hypothetical protein
MGQGHVPSRIITWVSRAMRIDAPVVIVNWVKKGEGLKLPHNVAVGFSQQ